MGERLSAARDAAEISDLVIDHDPETRARRPVSKSALADRFAGNRAALAVIDALPARDDTLDPAAVDALLLRVHSELQRLSEEFLQGERVRRWLVPLLEALRASGVPRPLRVVDVGCGLGYVVRWLAARGALGDDVELIGCDYNEALVDAAARAARIERLPCVFRVANAFALESPAHVFMSTGVVHHFRGPALVEFFRGQAAPTTQAFMHFDICPTWATPIGAWIFHVARMREPLSRHDGVLSALRAHDDETLISAARRGAPELRVGCVEGPNRWLPLTRLLRPVLGVRPALLEPLARALGPRRAACLEPLS